jgi:hypothetical protein
MAAFQGAAKKGAHLVKVLRLDALVDMSACLEHSETVRSEDLKHGLLVRIVSLIPDKPCLFNMVRFWHQERLDIDIGENCLRQRVS